jgi:hypothetical protein
MSFTHEGMSPQRISDNSRTGSLGFWSECALACAEAETPRHFEIPGSGTDRIQNG